MIILRNLLKYNILVQVVLDPLNIGTATNKGIAHAMYMYLNLQKIPLLLPIQVSAGVVASVPPVPGGGTASITMNIPSADSLAELLNSKPASPVGLIEPSAHVHMFSSIATWLAPLLATVGPVSIPPTITGAGPVLLPIMPILGLPCWATMVTLGAVGEIKDFDDGFEVLSNFIYAGLLANFIPPIATTGLAIPSSGPYTGVTVSLWPILDVPDFPVGTAVGYEDILTLLGLNGLDDDSIKEKQDEINSEEQPDNGEENVCNIKFEDDGFVCPDECTDEFFNDVCATGVTTCASLPTSSAELLTSASAENVNLEYLSISATPDVEIPDYSTTQVISVDTSLINITIITPTITANRKFVDTGINPGSFFSLSR